MRFTFILVTLFAVSSCANANDLKQLPPAPERTKVTELPEVTLKLTSQDLAILSAALINSNAPYHAVVDLEQRVQAQYQEQLKAANDKTEVK